MFAAPSVSRHHAVIRLDNGRCRLTDLNSTAGTFVNGAEVRGTVDVSDGDEISVADHRFVFDRQRVAQVVEAEGVQVDVVRARKELRTGACCCTTCRCRSSPASSWPSWAAAARARPR